MSSSSPWLILVVIIIIIVSIINIQRYLSIKFQTIKYWLKFIFPPFSCWLKFIYWRFYSRILSDAYIVLYILLYIALYIVYIEYLYCVLYIVYIEDFIWGYWARRRNILDKFFTGSPSFAHTFCLFVFVSHLNCICIILQWIFFAYFLSKLKRRQSTVSMQWGFWVNHGRN